MIVGKRKELEDIKKMVSGHKKVLIVGCDTCVSVCWAGGTKEVAALAAELEADGDTAGTSFLQSSVDRQCESEMCEVLRPQAQEADAILSMGCGAGAQILAELFDDRPVLPALDTTFLGVPTELGVWVENCGCCGDCTLDITGGICPIVRCGKGLLNGPCGGVRRNGKCELDEEKDCAWVQIYRRLEKQGRLDLMTEYREPRDHSAVKRPGIVKAPLAQKVWE